MRGSDLHHGRAVDVKMELAEIRVVRAKRAVGQISHRLPMLQEVGNRFLHVHLIHSLAELFAEGTA